MDGNCQVQSVVYRATVETADCRRDYTGLTALTFKERFNGHQYSMRHRSHRNSTALSKYVWSLKDKNTDFNIRWSVRRRATAYQNTTRMCNLCLAEKLEIIKADKKRSLNKRTELVSKCRHENRFYLCNFPPAVPWTGSPTFFRFSDVLFLPIFQIADFSILSNFSNYFRPFLILPLFFEFFEFFPVYNYALFIVFFDDFWCFFFLWFFRVYDFLWLFVFPLKSQLHACPLSSPMFSTLYLPANFCQFFRAQVVLRTTPFLSRPIRTTLLSKVWSFLFIKHLRIGWNT